MGNTVLDIEAGGQFGKIRLLARLRTLFRFALTSAEQRFGVAQRLRQIDTLDRTVLDCERGRAIERLLHRGHQIAGGGQVERHVTSTLQNVLPDRVSQQRPDRDSRQVLLDGNAVGIRIDPRHSLYASLI